MGKRSFITGVERQVLFQKYFDLGYCGEDIEKRINLFVDELRRIEIELISKNKSKEDIDKRFKKEFEKLCQRIV